MSTQAAIMGMQAFSGITSGIEGMKQANLEAATLRDNARLTDLQGNIDASTAMREMRMEDGAASVASAAGGVGAGNGSIGDILYAGARARWESALNIRQTANLEANAMRAQAKQVKKAGVAAMIRGVTMAGASVLGGTAKENAYQRTKTGIANYRKFQLQGLARTSLFAASFKPRG